MQGKRLLTRGWWRNSPRWSEEVSVDVHSAGGQVLAPGNYFIFKEEV